jgi:phosphopantetheinyl transferase (holo-ACP synthase)
MLSTGNDIVSLNAINKTRTNQPGFYSKILADAERVLYRELEPAGISFENFVWLLWSIKESAYKYLQRNTPGLVFSPTRFVVQRIEPPFGYATTNIESSETEGTGFGNRPVLKSVITFGSDTLYSKSFIYRELIVSVVNVNDDFGKTNWGVKFISSADPAYQSKAVRLFLLGRLNKLLQLDGLTIDKSPDGIPIVLNHDERIEIPVSLSHHDQWVAYSFQQS